MAVDLLNMSITKSCLKSWRHSSISATYSPRTSRCSLGPGSWSPRASGCWPRTSGCSPRNSACYQKYLNCILRLLPCELSFPLIGRKRQWPKPQLLAPIKLSTPRLLLAPSSLTISSSTTPVKARAVRLWVKKYLSNLFLILFLFSQHIMLINLLNYKQSYYFVQTITFFC